MNRIIFLHHSTGEAVWMGTTHRYVYKFTKNGDVRSYIKKFNRKNGTKYSIRQLRFPSKEGYGWQNYPYDYYTIWVKNAGEGPYRSEPTLEMLTKEYDIIAFKHCFPVSMIQEDTGQPDIDSREKRLENYKLQYNALKEKLHAFPDTKFILWSPAVNVQARTTPEMARRTQEFYRWILEEWNEKGDNIYLWDFYQYETEGGLYLKEEYATSSQNSHPNKEFSTRMAPVFGQFIIDVAQGNVD